MKKNLLTIGTLFMASLAIGQTTILSEAFEGTGLPAGWSLTQNTPSVGWEFGNNLGSTYWVVPTHTKYAASNDDAHDDNSTTTNLANLDRLITPSMNLSSVGSVVFLKFDAYYNGAYSSVATVEVSTNGGSTWTAVNTLAAVDGSWQNGLVVNLSAYAGQSNVMVAFHHDDSGEWASGFAIDNFEVYTPAAVDMEMTSLNINQYVAGPANTTIAGTVTNLGASTITSITIDWNDGTSHPQTFSVNLAPLATYNFNHGTQLAVAVGTTYNLTVSVSATSDAVAGNNSLSTSVYGLSFIPTTKVVGEEATGTWCGWCPRGAVYMEQMATDHPTDWIGIAVHNNDPMAVTAYDNEMGALIGGYPSGIVDRSILDIDPTDFPTAYADRIAVVRPAGVSITNTWNSTTRAMTVTVTANYAATMTGVNWRLAAIVVEDDVTGTTSGYNQTNYYSSQSQNIALTGAGHNWQTEPNPVPAASMSYDHVGRALLGGWDGQAGSVPTSVTAGGTNSYTFNHTLPSTQDETQIKLVGLIVDQTTGEIINANEMEMALGLTEQNDIFEFGLYPNPANDIATIKLNLKEEGDVKIDIYSLTGALVNSTSYGTMSGSQNFIVNASMYDAGVYFVNVTVNGSVISKKMTVTH